MTRESLVCWLPRGGEPLGAESRGGFPAKQALRCGNPIAESLWPTIPGPFHHWRVHSRAALPERALPAPMLSTPATKTCRRGPRMLPRVPCNFYAANGFPVSACSWTLVLPGSRSIRTWPAML